MSAAWELVTAEAQRGHRRYAETAVGEHYQRIRAFHMDSDGADPRMDQRTLGDLVAPERPLRAVDVVNAASKALGRDAADWSVVRLLSLVAQEQQSAQQAEG